MTREQFIDRLIDECGNFLDSPSSFNDEGFEVIDKFFLQHNEGLPVKDLYNLYTELLSNVLTPSDVTKNNYRLPLIFILRVASLMGIKDIKLFNNMFGYEPSEFCKFLKPRLHDSDIKTLSFHNIETDIQDWTGMFPNDIGTTGASSSSKPVIACNQFSYAGDIKSPECDFPVQGNELVMWTSTDKLYTNYFKAVSFQDSLSELPSVVRFKTEPQKIILPKVSPDSKLELPYDFYQFDKTIIYKKEGKLSIRSSKKDWVLKHVKRI